MPKFSMDRYEIAFFYEIAMHETEVFSAPTVLISMQQFSAKPFLQAEAVHWHPL